MLKRSACQSTMHLHYLLFAFVKVNRRVRVGCKGLEDVDARIFEDHVSGHCSAFSSLSAALGFLIFDTEKQGEKPRSDVVSFNKPFPGIFRIIA